MGKRPERARKSPPGAAESSVDLTLIRWMVRLTPNQRLAVLQDHVRFVSALRRAVTTD